jgi:AcrR family transcriptional regulator
VKGVRTRAGRKTLKTRPEKDLGEDRSAFIVPPEAALALFVGQPAVTLDTISRAVQVDVAILTERYPDVNAWLAAVLRAHDLMPDFINALDMVTGESADELLRDAMRQLVETAQRHASYLELALLEADRYQGNTLTSFGTNLLPAATRLFTRIKDTGALRPLPDWIVARALVSLFIGFLASERAMPQLVRTASRLLPQRAWIDGVTDIMLYGLLEDDAR